VCCAQAWDTLFWFAVLVGMSGQLNSSGVINHFADIVGGKLTAMNMGWQPVFGLLNAAYFGLHYMFASQTAHVGALYAAFLAMMLSAGEFILMSQALNVCNGNTRIRQQPKCCEHGLASSVWPAQHCVLCPALHVCLPDGPCERPVCGLPSWLSYSQQGADHHLLGHATLSVNCKST